MTFRTVKIAGQEIGEGKPVFIVAEAGVNHFGDMDRARRLVDMAVSANTDAVKFQVYKTGSMIARESGEWIERMKQKELSYRQVEEIKRYCDAQGIIFLASAHEEESLDFLHELEVPAFKVGSGEKGNTQYLRYAAQKGRPVILSTGMCDLGDVAKAVATLETGGCKDIVLLHCVSLYPTKPAEVNLRAMDTLHSQFNSPVGYSDHTIGSNVVLAAVARGACCIEKHIALEKDMPNTQDPLVSCDSRELVDLVAGIREIEAALGSSEKKQMERERESELWARKSLVSRKYIRKGTVLTIEMLVAKRPGTGIVPEHIETVVGKSVLRDVDVDEVIRPEWLSDGY